MVGRILMPVAAIAVLAAGNQAIAETTIERFLPENGVIRLGAGASELLSDLFGIVDSGALLVRLHELSRSDQDGGTVWTLGDLHRIELAGTEEDVASLVIRSFSARLTEQAGFIATADLVELWTRSGELLLSLAKPSLQVDEGSYGIRITLDAESAGMSSSNASSTELRLSGRYRSGQVSIGFNARALQDSAGSFTVDARQLSCSVSVPGRPAAVLAWRVDKLEVDAERIGAAGQEFMVRLTGTDFTAPGGISGKADGFKFQTVRSPAESTVEIDRLRISETFAKQLFPALAGTPPPLSARLVLTGKPDSNQPAGRAVAISELNVALGNARLNAEGAFENGGQALDVKGRIDGLLAILQAMGAADPAALAARIGLLYSQKEIAKDTVRLELDANAQWLRVNGKPLLLVPVEQ